MKINHDTNIGAGEEAEYKLYQAIAAIQTPEEARKFLRDLCTPMELQAMADRWLAVNLIKAGKPYRKIYEETGISVTTTGRVARCIMFGEGGYNLIYERLEKRHEDQIKTPNRSPKKRSIKQ